MDIPYIPPEIVRFLEEKFRQDMPERMLDDPREYDFRAGQQSVVRTMQRLSERQNTENLEDY